ncbi:hypothetical protein MAPG_11638 [Magnaporthiopsis poae ATCC 64411]|uniref:Uncharacterized protein n=1 Tax=Magnaporthiopsis poae (strain ATCC 64411 / 73-15) TaxID=644358 RepID=A0A0C4EFT2_MAGP6|nr:hypothetical protein MAPG_11638 [Magnaporthiopsis poae ATCC 64411]
MFWEDSARIKTSNGLFRRKAPSDGTLVADRPEGGKNEEITQHNAMLRLKRIGFVEVVQQSVQESGAENGWMGCGISAMPQAPTAVLKKKKRKMHKAQPSIYCRARSRRSRQQKVWANGGQQYASLLPLIISKTCSGI